MLALQAVPVQAEEDPMDADQPVFTVSAINTTDVLANVKGGLHAGARVLDKFEGGIRFLGNAQFWPGVSAFLTVQGTDATAFSENLVGDLQNVSNLNGPAGLRLSNAWVAKTFGGTSGVKAGIIDLNSEFDVQTIAALFLNASHGIGLDYSQSGLNGPDIFPSYGLGVVGWGLMSEHWQWKSGIFEGTPGNPANPGAPQFMLSGSEGALLTLEIRNRPSADTVIGLGGWFYTASFDALESGPLGPARVHGNAGVYGLFETSLFTPENSDRAGLKGWIRDGIADPRINAVDFYTGGGLVYDGPWGRPADQIGFAIAYAHFGAPARRAAGFTGASIGAGETNFELTYSYALGGLLTIQPDIQYVISPSANRAIPNALIIGTRMIFAWP
jgi:porin